jgi:DNA replication protein DnaC
VGYCQDIKEKIDLERKGQIVTIIDEHISTVLLELYASGYKYLSGDFFKKIKQHLPHCEMCQTRLKDAIETVTSWSTGEEHVGPESDQRHRFVLSKHEHENPALVEELRQQSGRPIWDRLMLRSMARYSLLADSLSFLAERIDRDSLDYMRKDIWVGGTVLDDSKTKQKESSYDSEHEQHSRWRRFDIDQLTEPRGDRYLVCGEAGVGKTTLLRFLQSRILKRNTALAVYFRASELSGIDFLSIGILADHLGRTLGGAVPMEDWECILTDAFEVKQLVLLIDGIDEVNEPKGGYTDLVRRITANTGDNSVIFTARPRAAREFEYEESLRLLWLGPFDSATCRVFFGDYYDKAAKSCKRDKELLTVPIYAYLVRELIGTGLTRGYRSKWDLYSHFVNHRLNTLESCTRQYKGDFIDKVFATLGRISYDAIAQREPMWPIIPHSFWSEYWKDSTVSAEIILSTGVANFIPAGRESCPSLVFWHRSFQEFMAAKWAGGSDERISQIINESHELKWKGVIKFLAGAMGHSFVKRLYKLGCQDDITHSRLFLAAECCREISRSKELERKLVPKLTELLSKEPDALVSLSKLSSHQAVAALVKFVVGYRTPWPDSLYGRAKLAEALSDINARLLSTYLYDIIHLLWANDDLIYDRAIEILSQVASHLTFEQITEIVEVACRRGKVDELLLLPQIKQRISQYHKELLSRFTQEEDHDGWDAAIEALSRLGDEQQRDESMGTRYKHNFGAAANEEVSKPKET